MSAIPIVNRIFGYFDNSGIGFTANKYEELGEVINKTIDKNGTKVTKGNWEYNIKTIKGINSETYTGDRKLNVDGGEILVDSLVKTPVSNLLTINGKYESGTNETLELDNLEYIIRDNKGNELITVGLGGHSDVEGNYQRKIKILSDLSNVEYIEILQYERAEEKSIRREMNDTCRWEGHEGAIIETKEFSMTLSRISLKSFDLLEYYYKYSSIYNIYIK